MEKKRLCGIAGVTAALALAVAGAGTAGAQSRQSSAAPAAASAKSPVKVGIIYTRTGLLSAYGAEYIQGFRLGLQYATHGTGKVNGRKIEVTTVDDGFDAAKAVSAAKDLIGRGYKIIGGSVGSGIALQVGPVAAQNKVLYISGPAANDGITGLNRYTFRSGRQTIQDVLAIKGALGKKAAAGRKIVVFAQDSAFGQGNVAAVKAYLGTRHRVESILVPLSASDFTPFAQQAKNAKPDLLYVAWAGTTYSAVFRAFAQQGVFKATKVATGLAERATWSTYPSPGGITFLTHYVSGAPKNKVNNWLKRAMRRRGQVPDLFTPDGFVAAQMIVRAIQKGGGDNVDRMIRALEGWQFLAPKGLQRIRQADHAMIQPMFSVSLKKVKGKLVATPLRTFSPATMAPPVKRFP